METIRLKLIRTLLFLLIPLSAISAWTQTLSASAAKNHIGETTTVCGNVASERTSTGTRGEPTFINLDAAYPNQVFTILIWSQDRSNVGVLPRIGARACVLGTIQSYRGVPEIVVKSSGQFKKASTEPTSNRPCRGSDSYYTNSDGQRVHSPECAPSAPAGATAQCRDGSYSFSQHRQGTCSHHGGVAHWL
jgi:hypothetical protein